MASFSSEFLEIKKKLQNIEDLTKSKYSFEDITPESAHINFFMEAIKKFRGLVHLFVLINTHFDIIT